MSAWKHLVEKSFSGNQEIFNGRPNVLVYTATPNLVITAPIGTLCWDVTNGDGYINTDGTTAWTKINA